MLTAGLSMPASTPPPVLLCFGDSITANGRWVAAPEAAGPWRLVNAGRSGRKTADIAAELPPALAAHPEAAGLMVFLGVNDLPARDPKPDDEKIAASLAHLQNAVDLALARFAPEAIFLVAPCTVDAAGLDSVNLAKGYQITPPLLARLGDGIADLARANRVNFIDLRETLGPGDFSDGLHPNARGDAALAQAIGRALADQGLPANGALRAGFYLVGDSISIDYHEALARECLGRFRYTRKGGLELARKDLDHPQGANGGDSTAVLAHLREALESPETLPDALLVNAGLHDIKTPPATGERQVSLTAYRANLVAIAELARTKGKRLVWITTTPVDEARHNARSRFFHRFEADVAAYNAIAREVMSAQGVSLIDLYGFTTGLDEPLYRDHVHFLPAVSEKQAAFVRARLDELFARATP